MREECTKNNKTTDGEDKNGGIVQGETEFPIKGCSPLKIFICKTGKKNLKGMKNKNKKGMQLVVTENAGGLKEALNELMLQAIAIRRDTCYISSHFRYSYSQYTFTPLPPY